MANWLILKNAIAEAISSNNNQEITGSLLQSTLTNIIDSLGENATFAGIATPITSPGISDGPVFYIASTEGFYSNFNNIELGKGETAILYFSNTTWVKKTFVEPLEQDLGENENKAMSQKAVTENINSLNESVEKLYSVTGVDEYSQFSTSRDYSAGEVVLYDGVLFKFTTGKLAGEWSYALVEPWSEKKEREEKLTELGEEVDGKIAKIAVYEDNPEYIRLYKDLNDRLLWGIKGDGSIEFGKGVPTPIKKYIQETVSNIFENISEIEVEVGNIKENYLNLIDSKEYIRAYFDAEGKILWGIKGDGSIEWSKGIPTPIKDAFRAIYEIIDNHSVDIDKSLVRDEAGNSFSIPLKYVSNNEFAYAIVDLRDKLLFGIKHDGSIFGKSFAVNPEDIVNQGLINSDSNMNRLKAKLKVCEEEDAMEGLSDSSFMFVRTQRITDAWRNYTIDRHDDYIIIRDDQKTIQINYSDVFSGTGKFKYARLIPFDYNRLNTDANMALMVVNAAWEIKRCDITNINNALNTSNWSDANLWEKKGSARKIPTKDINSVDSYHRYDTTLADSSYQYTKVDVDNGHIQFQGKRPMHSLMNNIGRGKRIVGWGDYININNTEYGRPCIWVTTDGAENIIAVVDFVPDESSHKYTLTNASPINTSHFQDYTEGLNLYHILRNMPTAETQDPFRYTNNQLSGFNIVKGTETIIELDNHGLADGDIVRFADAGATAEWKQLASTITGDARNSMGDNVYDVVVIDSNSFYLKEYTGSYDNQIQTRHVHSCNETKNGLIFCTGEEYPNGWSYYLRVPGNAPSHEYDMMKRNPAMYRLNSSEMSIQRLCGFIMEGQTDPVCYVFSDTDNYDMGTMSIGDRVYNLPKAHSNGIWKGKVSMIDDWTTWECVCPVPEVAIWTYKMGRTIITYWQSNGFTVSVDDGHTFTYYPQVSLESTDFCGVHNGRIVINNGYEFIPLDSVNLDGIYERLDIIENSINN